MRSVVMSQIYYLTLLKVLPRCLSDHNGISREVRMTRKALARRIRNIDHAKFAHDVAVKMSTLGGEHDVDAAVQHYNGSVISLLDRHAPLKFRTIGQRKTKP